MRKRVVIKTLVEHTRTHPMAVVAAAHQILDLMRTVDKVCILRDGILTSIINIPIPIKNRINAPATSLLGSVPIELAEDSCSNNMLLKTLPQSTNVSSAEPTTS